jgi:hypothetical protein
VTPGRRACHVEVTRARAGFDYDRPALHRQGAASCRRSDWKDKGMIPECDIGNRYRTAERTMFGRDSEIWEVVSTFQAIDGLRYAQLVHVHDRTRTKTIAADGLLDKRLYSPA